MTDAPIDPDDVWVGDDKFAHIRRAELEAAVEAKGEAPPVKAVDYDPARDDGIHASAVGHKHHKQSLERRLELMTLVQQGYAITEACDKVGVRYQTYKSWRQRFPVYAAKIDEARQLAAFSKNASPTYRGIAHFSQQYFGMAPTWFQLLFLEELQKLPLGNILMVLWPPEHGKTTTFENYACYKLATDASYRFLVASENQGIAKKINGRVMDRMHPNGPTPNYVAQYGPFVPQSGGGIAQVRQPWTDTKFRVYKARESDERNFSMEAVGVNGSIVSARCNHLHVDDAQSTRTLARSEAITTWFRQDALSRPSESGVTSVCGTRVGDGDFYEDLLQDGGLDDIMKVIRFPAVITDNETGEQKPLWEGKHTLESLDRMRRKVGDEIWDRNWMQNPGASRKGRGTFTTDMVEACQDPERSLEHHPGDEGERQPYVYIGVDPALGSKNCIIAAEVTPEGQLIIRKIREDIGFERNEQIMAALESVVRWSNMTGVVTDVVIEDKNFQLGLKNDERMTEMSTKYGFKIRGHLTGWNKYDADIGVAAMATAFIKREIVLPWKADTMTRHEIGELKRQLYAWKPGARGNKLRQDRVMALWFIWMLWGQRRKSLVGVGSNSVKGFTRQTMDWTVNPTGLIVPN